MRILVTPTSLQPDKCCEALEKLKEFSSDILFNITNKPLEEEDLIPLLKECDGYIAGLDFITKKVIDACSKLKVISRYGVGYDRVDIEAAKEKGIIVTNTPGANSEAVGELAFALLLSVARKIPYLDEQTRSGAWVRSTGVELKGKQLGIMGFGAIGKVVARCGQGFGMKVCTYDPYIDQKYCADYHIEILSKEELLRRSHVISLHLPLTSKTKHMLDKNAFEIMRKGVIVINTSRGGIIDEKAAYDALKSGKAGGLGLDTFEFEPPVDSPLFEFKNVVVTPHTGAHTKEATDNMANLAVENLIAVLSGRQCNFIVNR